MYEKTLIALVLSRHGVAFRSSNVVSSVNLGREECGTPAISSSGVDAVMLVVLGGLVLRLAKMSINYL
jgi:hypothetical protein